jgi:DNA repair photolyase
MKRWGNQKPVRFDEKELKTDLGKDNFIFVGSSCDMFAEDIPEDWIYETFEHCDQYKNKYFFQSKNPEKFVSFFDVFPIDSSFCTTIETNRVYENIMKNSPPVWDRSLSLWNLSYLETNIYITVEPILDFDLKGFIEMIKQCDPIQVNIGADSGNNNLPEPPKEKIIELISELEKFTKVKQKKNLNRLFK